MTLKKKLLAELSALDAVNNMDADLLMVLKLELQSQINNLTDANKHELEELFKVMKDWANEKIASNQVTPIPDKNTNVNKTGNTQANHNIPQTGENSFIYWLMVGSVAMTVRLAIKYKKYKNI